MNSCISALVISLEGTLSDHLFGLAEALAVILSRSMNGLETALNSLFVYSISIILEMVKDLPNPAVS